MNNKEKKIVSYDPKTGEPIYKEKLDKTKAPHDNNKKRLTIGIIIEIILFLLLIVIFILLFISKNSNTIDTTEEKIFYGESYEIKYKYPWTESTKTLKNGDEEKHLTYNKQKIVLVPLDSSDLSKTATTDFSTSTGKFKLYNDFREYFGRTYNVSGGTGTFYTLVDDTYYASMNYTRGSIQGKFYLVVSKDNNVLLSFSTEVNMDKEKADKIVLKLLKNINTDTIYDDQLSGYLDTMTNWNVYKSARSGELGKKKTIEGGWRTLSNGEEYWTFVNGKYNYYKSLNDLNDNYWSGTYKVYTGKEGTSKVGIEDSKVENIIARNEGIKEKDIYTMILTPKKIMSGGEDNTSTNFGDENRQLVWILIDHGKEGIEGQQLNVKTFDISHFVKIKD